MGCEKDGVRLQGHSCQWRFACVSSWFQAV